MLLCWLSALRGDTTPINFALKESMGHLVSGITDKQSNGSYISQHRTCDANWDAWSSGKQSSLHLAYHHVKIVELGRARGGQIPIRMWENPKRNRDRSGFDTEFTPADATWEGLCAGSWRTLANVRLPRSFSTA